MGMAGDGTRTGAGGGRGAESFCYWQYGAGGRLAACIQRQLVSAMQAIDNGYLDRGIKERKTAKAFQQIRVRYGFLWFFIVNFNRWK